MRRRGLPAGLLVAVAFHAAAVRADEAPTPPARPPELGTAPSPDAGPVAGAATAAPATGPRADDGDVPPSIVTPTDGTVPLPPTKPADTAPTTDGSADDCLQALRAAGHHVEAAAQPGAAASGCIIDHPVKLMAVAAGAGPSRTIKLPASPIVACRFARSFAVWAGRVAAPVLSDARGSPLVALRSGEGFACRGRNQQPGAKPSAHGEGLALDIVGFEFADGHSVTVDAATMAEPALAAVRVAACGWFMTVLGPGADAYHRDHLHLDIEQHGSSDRYRICQ